MPSGIVPFAADKVAAARRGRKIRFHMGTPPLECLDWIDPCKNQHRNRVVADDCPKLKRELQSELNHSRWPRASDCAERAAAHRLGRTLEVRLIEQIEELRAEAQLSVFLSEREVLVQSQIGRI